MSTFIHIILFKRKESAQRQRKETEISMQRNEIPKGKDRRESVTTPKTSDYFIAFYTNSITCIIMSNIYNILLLSAAQGYEVKQ